MRSQYNKGVECYSSSGELIASYNTSNSDLKISKVAAIDDPAFFESIKFGGQSISLSLDNLGRGMALGADAYLPKPFERDILITTINKLLNQ